MKTQIKIALASVAVLAGLGLASPANAADHFNISLAFGYPQPVVEEVYRAHPTCRAHPRWNSCRNYYHAAYGRHYHGRHDPHWRHDNGWHGHR
jgi:hypothetical protein